MATRLKLFAGLFVVLCIMQLVQMAPEERFRRDDSPAQSDIDTALKKAEEKFKEFMSNENTQKFINAASNAITDIAKGLEDQFHQFKEKLESEKSA